MPWHVVVGGPANCGKSTLVASAYSLLHNNGESVGLHEIDVYSDTIHCILGHKPWTERRKRKQCHFNPTIKRRIDEFACDSAELVLGDLPGKLTNQFLPKMVEPADAAVVVAKDWNGMEQWQEFFAKQHVPVMARVMSCLETPPAIPLSAPTVHFVFGLDRTVQVSPAIRSFTAMLLDLAAPQQIAIPAQ